MSTSEKGVFGRRTFVVGALAGGALATLAGCGKKGETGGAKSEKKVNTDAVLNFYLPVNPKCIDPYDAAEEAGYKIVSLLFDPLMQYDSKTAQLKPCVCKSWEVNDRADLFTFHLVPDAKFHNGEPVDAQAFKRAWERIVNPKTGRGPSTISYHLALIEGYKDLLEERAAELTGVTCPDKYTLVVKLSEPFADFLYVVAYAPLSPVPKAALENFDAFYRAPIGNGPFEMDGTWEDGQYIRVKRFDGYYGEKSKVKGIHYRIIDSSETAFNEFKSGNLDNVAVPSSHLEDVKATYGVSDDGYTVTPGKRTLLGDVSLTWYLSFNLKDPVMANANVRRALSLGINREAICATVFKGTRSPADNVVPPTIKGYEKDAWKYARYDPKEAERLLDIDYPRDASGKRNLEVRLSCSTLRDQDAKLEQQAIMSDWEKLGVTVRLDPKEWGTFLTEMKEGKHQIGDTGWRSDYPIMDNFLYPVFFTGAGNNHSFYSNPAVDTLILRARAEPDQDKRIALQREANVLIAEDVPVVPLVFGKFQGVCSERIKYYYANPEGRVDWSTVEVDG